MKNWDTGDKVAAILLSMVTLIILSAIGACTYSVIEDNKLDSAAMDACWECGWTDFEIINGEYFCLINDHGSVVAREIDWVQENACQ